jgi:hypothetical protein
MAPIKTTLPKQVQSLLPSVDYLCQDYGLNPNQVVSYIYYTGYKVNCSTNRY